jgi:hypothetical protein
MRSNGLFKVLEELHLLLYFSIEVYIGPQPDINGGKIIIFSELSVITAGGHEG